MKKVFALLLILASIPHFSIAQKAIKMDSLIKTDLVDYDLSKLFQNQDPNPEIILGFIGEDYQRLRIHFVTVTKDASEKNTYQVAGKSMVKNNICDFKGEIKVRNVVRNRETDVCETGYHDRATVHGSYLFYEDSTQNHAGIFEGKLETYVYFDAARNVYYDTLWNCSDAYCNNQFDGTWRSYASIIRKKCNWGDYRIPDTRGPLGFDLGAGEFSPDPKYRANGWQEYDLQNLNDPTNKAWHKYVNDPKNRYWWKQGK